MMSPARGVSHCAVRLFKLQLRQSTYLLNWVRVDEPNSLAKRNGTITTPYKGCGVLPGEIMIQAD